MKYSILILLAALHCSSAQYRNKSFVNEVKAFETYIGASGKAAYVTEYNHPFEQAFLENNIPMLEYFYEQAIANADEEYHRRIKSVNRKLVEIAKQNPPNPEFPMFRYKDKLMFALMINHAKKPECLQAAMWLTTKPLLLRMHIRHTTGTSYTYSEAGSKAGSRGMTEKEHKARTYGNLIQEHNVYTYWALPPELGMALYEQRLIEEDFKAAMWNHKKAQGDLRIAGDDEKWLEAYNNGVRRTREIPQTQLRPILRFLENDGITPSYPNSPDFIADDYKRTFAMEEK